MGTINTEKMLKMQLDYTIKMSLFYQTKWVNVNSDNLFNQFYKLPFTTKKEILEDQKSFPPFGSNLCVPQEEILRVHKTSGTTNSPVIIALTENDIFHILDVGGSCFKTAGLLPSDTVMHCLNYNMWAGGFTDHQNLEQTGATVVPFGVGNTKALVQMIKLLRATAIHCTPSYLSKIEQVLKDEFNMMPHELGLRIALLGAESGLQNSVYRKAIEDKWGFIAMNANYGLSEVLSIIGSECHLQRGLHFRASEKLLLELIDVNTEQSLPVEKGACGEMVLTNLCKEAQPLIRYRTGDIITITDTECPCSCGQPIFEIVGRTDDMMVIRGLNVFPSAISTIILKYLPFITNEYRILVSKEEPIEAVVVQIEKNPRKWKDRVSQLLIHDIKEELNVSVELEVLDENALERSEGKTQRVLKVLT